MFSSLLSEDEISRRLAAAGHGETEIPFPTGFIQIDPKPASVLMPLLQVEGRWHLLFIRRTANLRDPHSGQVAFPGGAGDPEDGSVLDTALRETYEEIGLPSSMVRVLGTMHAFITVTGYRVTPIVGAIPWPCLLKLAENEVSRAFTIPLDWLADRENLREVLQELPAPFKPVPVIYFHPYDGEILWGASARFTQCLIEILSN
jgi:8-oxo-dGTP pyrophosphatase MutT (NUDIX family)